jgi:DNA-binding response OmpR family regulator
MTKKILIVDDEKNIRITLKHCLENQDYVIESAVNGEEALHKLQTTNFDLILLDIKMPGLTGMEVLKKIREMGNKVDVIMMTAYGTIERAVEAMKLGAIDFINKPFTPDEIREIVKDVLYRQSLNEDKVVSFKDTIEFAKKCILSGDYEKAKEFLNKALSKNPDSPEPHNLMGVLLEMNNNVLQAQKHYRAALALDPTYVPADKNLQRTVQMTYTKKGIDLGGGTESEEK